MKKELKLICEPAVANHRFLLGKKGDNNLLVIALNPNTAAGNQHDSTTRNIEKIAFENGFDGWVLFNLSPVRDPKPENLMLNEDRALQEENFKQFCKIVNDKEWEIQNVWLAWGNGVLGRAYLKNTAIEMLKHLALKPDIKYFYIKRTQQHHPYHSAQRVINSFFKKEEKISLRSFPAQAYREFILEYNSNEN
jgi:hypothetical protein